MALHFDGVDDNLTGASPPFTGYPFTMGCWFNPDNITDNEGLMRVWDGTGSNQLDLSVFGGVAGDPIRFRANAAGAGFVNADTSTGYSAGVWQHACAVGRSATNRDVYLNGGSKGSNATSRAPTGINEYLIGTVSTVFTGAIAEPFAYNTDLSDAEVAALAAGVSPLRIRPANLKFYRRFIRNESIPLVGSQVFTVNGGGLTVVAHPPKIEYPWRPIGGAPKIAAAGGGTVAPLAMHQYRQRRAA